MLGIIWHLSWNCFSPTLINDQVEVIVLRITTLNLLIINCYHPPQCDHDAFSEAIEKTQTVVDAISSPTPKIIVCSDFDFPFISWPDGQLTGETLADQVQAKVLLSLADKLFLTQQITTPPRKNNILDLFFINNHVAVTSYSLEKTVFSVSSLCKQHKRKEKWSLHSHTKLSPFKGYDFLSSKIDWKKDPIASWHNKMGWDHGKWRRRGNGTHLP